VGTAIAAEPVAARAAAFATAPVFAGRTAIAGTGVAAARVDSAAAAAAAAVAAATAPLSLLLMPPLLLLLMQLLLMLLQPVSLAGGL
jgi:hypothetical protein